LGRHTNTDMSMEKHDIASLVNALLLWELRVTDFEYM